MIFGSKTPKFKPARFTSAEWIMIRHVSEEAVKHMQKRLHDIVQDFIEEPSVADLPYKDVFESDWRYSIEGEAADLRGKRRIIEFIFTFSKGSLDKKLTYTRHLAGGVQREKGVDKPIEIESMISNELPIRFLLTHQQELTNSFIINIGHEFNHFKNPWVMTEREKRVQHDVSSGKASFVEYVNSPSEFDSRLNQILVQISLENEAGDDVLRRHWNILSAKDRMDYVYDILSRNEEWHISGKLWTPEHRARVVRSVIWYLNGGEIYHDREAKKISPRENGEIGFPNVRLRKTPRRNVNRKTIDMLPYGQPRRPGMRYLLEPGETREMFNPEDIKKLTEVDS